MAERQMRATCTTCVEKVLEAVFDYDSDDNVCDEFLNEGTDDSSDEDFMPEDDQEEREEDESGPSGKVVRHMELGEQQQVPLPDVATEDFSDDEFSYLCDWSRNVHEFPLIPPFTGRPGLHLPADFPDTPTPLDFYKLFVTNDVLKSLKKETNRYAKVHCEEKLATVGDKELSPRSFFRTWNPVSMDEIAKFITILIHMGLVKKSRMQDYWAKDVVLNTPFASLIMSRPRFQQILTFFHVNDNATLVPRGLPNYDPLHKIRPFLNHLVERFRSLYTPEENICVDEAMCPWRGRSMFRVYMKNKPTKWGMKLYELCESSSGYVYNFEVMCHQPGVSNKPYDVTCRLLKPLANQGYTLYIDNYYCCPTLAADLAFTNTSVVGTVRANHVGLPQELMTEKLKLGQVTYRRKNQVMCLRWKDKREVAILTTKHLPTMKLVISRYEQKLKPTCVADYNAHMAGVDKSDQMVSYLPLHCKTFKWWKKLFFHLLTLAMIQAHCLFNKYQVAHQGRKMDLQAFVTAVCRDLASIPGQDREIQPSGSTVPAQLKRLQPGNHFPELISNTGQKTTKPVRRCTVCSAKSKLPGMKSKVTRYTCHECLVPLCPYPCFRIYHTQRDLTK